MIQQQQLSTFEIDVLPHLDAAYNLARWLMRNEQDAQDVVQEAILRALRYFAGLRSRDARPWLLKIVRRTCYTRLREKLPSEDTLELTDDLALPDAGAPNAESAVLREESDALVRQAVNELPARLREVLILRELEGMCYREIAEITGMPAGTVMSTLSRARARLRRSLTTFTDDRAPHAYGTTVIEPTKCG